MNFKVGSQVVAYGRGQVLAAGPLVAIVKATRYAPTTYLVDDAATGQVLQAYGSEVVARARWLGQLGESAMWRDAWAYHLALAARRRADNAAHGVSG